MSSTACPHCTSGRPCLRCDRRRWIVEERRQREPAWYLREAARLNRLFQRLLGLRRRGSVTVG